MALYRDDLVEEVLLNLAGFLTDQELVGTLDSTTTAAATSFTVNGSVFTDWNVSGFRPGLCEIGNELIIVGAVSSGGVFSSIIRGYRGTTPYAWPTGTLVRDNPRIPRLRVVRALNDTINEVAPTLYQVVETDIVPTASTNTYDVPATTLDVLRVESQSSGMSEEWRTSRRWSFNPSAGSTSATGKTITVEDYHLGTIHVTHTAPPTPFSEASGTNELVTATGLPEWCKEVLTLGAAYKLIGYLDAGGVATRTAEGDLMALQTPIGKAKGLAEHYYALYTTRLEAASQRLRDEYRVGGLVYEARGPAQRPWPSRW